jgi:hypothetical protein
MMMTSNANIMGKFKVAGTLQTIGWTATIVMAAAAIGMGFTAFGLIIFGTAGRLRTSRTRLLSRRTQAGFHPSDLSASCVRNGGAENGGASATSQTRPG